MVQTILSWHVRLLRYYCVNVRPLKDFDMNFESLILYLSSNSNVPGYEDKHKCFNWLSVTHPYHLMITWWSHDHCLLQTGREIPPLRDCSRVARIYTGDGTFKVTYLSWSTFPVLVPCLFFNVECSVWVLIAFIIIHFGNSLKLIFGGKLWSGF